MTDARSKASATWQESRKIPFHQQSSEIYFEECEKAIYTVWIEALSRDYLLIHLDMEGHPHRTKRGQLSLLVTELPRLLSPCLHEMPTALQDPETRIRNRHVDFQVNDRAAQMLRFRSQIITRIREYLQAKGYLEVQTPIMANLAGGAVARPFQTHAVEFPDRHIELRTAPELWLKRLVLGGFERIFEIGPNFRNEGMRANSHLAASLLT